MGSLTRCPILKRFIRSIECFAPLEYADRSWDNVGLLLESPSTRLSGNTCRILLTIDLTEEVYNEASKLGCGIIFSYHPPWFRGEKSLTLDTGRGIFRTVALCAASNMSIYSSHSALDSIDGGMNDHVLDVLFRGEIVEKSVINPLSFNPKCGAGRVAALKEPLSIKEIANRWTFASGIPNLRLALTPSSTLETFIETVAVCVGSGSSVLFSAKADLYITGEMSHHDILRAIHASNTNVMLTEHTNCERLYLKNCLKSALSEALCSEENSNSDCVFEIHVSEADRDPVTIYTNSNAH